MSQEGMQTQSGEVICLQVHSFQGGQEDEEMVNNSTRAELGEMAKGSRTVTRNTERELHATMSTTEQGRREVLSRKNELCRKEEELSSLLAFLNFMEKRFISRGSLAPGDQVSVSLLLYTSISLSTRSWSVS